MKNEKQPSFQWLERHIDDETVIQYYLPEFLLAEVYSPTVLRIAQQHWSELPFYVKESLDTEIVSLILNPVDNMQAALNQYWIQRAVKVLRGYADCQVPFSDDKRIVVPHRDLLSKKGHKQLSLLEQAIAENRSTNQLGKQARAAAQKAGLDLTLFIDMDYLDILNQNRFGLCKNIDVSMTSGCYNGCVHCGYEAKAPVSHMPYPIFLKVAQKIYGTASFQGPCYIYTDSDPIAYRDPIINADSGDVIMMMNTILKNKDKSNIQFVTKGVLTKRDEIAFGKIVHHANLFRFKQKNDWRPVMGLDISFVDLPGEAVAKNFERVKRTLEICMAIDPKVDFTLRYYVLPEQEQIPFERLLTLPGVSLSNIHISGFDAIGRWGEKMKEEGVKIYKGWYVPRVNLTDDRYVICSNLTMYDVYRKDDKLIWQPLGSVLDRNFITRLSNSVRLHPTVLQPQSEQFSKIKNIMRHLFGSREMLS